jgi:hypothetical protein
MPSASLDKRKERFLATCPSQLLEKWLVVGEYISGKDKIEFKCKRCGKSMYQAPSEFKRRPKECSGCLANDRIKEFINESNAKYPGIWEEYSVDGIYVNGKTPLKFVHKSCGFEFNMRPANFKNIGQRCPMCSSKEISKGERRIAEYLDSIGIKYTPQKTFEDLYDTRELSYDFYLEDYKLLIEYQGEQHEREVSYFGGKDKFSKQVKYDTMKRDYAVKNNLTLIEIPYVYNPSIEYVRTFIEELI